MTHNSNGNRIKLWTPATYRIEVEGHLNESWSDRLAGMQITSHNGADQSTVINPVRPIKVLGRAVGRAQQPLWPAPADLEIRSGERRIAAFWI